MLSKMTNAFKYVCFLLLLGMIQCKKEYSLPAETQTGAGTFGCKLNGKVWVPKGSDGYSGQNTDRAYSYSGCYFLLSSTDYESKPLSTFVIGFDSACAQVGVPIKLASGRMGQGGARYFTIGYNTSDNTEYGTTDSITGELIFTKFSPPITSGTFWFDAIDTAGQIIHVTEGRFDINH
jgi:hypothetical protein